MKRLNATGRVALGLVSLAATLVLIFDLAFGLLPNESEAMAQYRQRSSRYLGIQLATLLQGRNLAPLSATLEAVLRGDPELRSIALRRADGPLVAIAGEHTRHWVAPKDGASNPTHILVPIEADVRRGGRTRAS